MADAATGSLVVDTEDAQVQRDIRINGSPSVLSVKEAQIILVWEDGEAQRYYMVSIVGAPELTDPAIILRIAENLD